MSAGKFRARVALAVLGCWLGIAGAFAADDLLTRARELMDRKDPKAAYELLVPHQSERAGDPAYDYLLGVAALDAGKPGEAVFALERVLAVQPDHKQARAEIARAYYELGEVDAAKKEFENVQRMGVPAEVSATIGRYLDAIQQLDAVPATQVRAYLEAGGGYDSNVNTATSAALVAVPVFGGALFQLAQAAVEQSDWFGTLGGGAAVRHPLSQQAALFGAIDGYYRWNESVSDFDRGQLTYSLGGNWFRGKNVFTLAFQGDNFWLDGDEYRNAYGGVAQWQYNVNARTQTTLYAQYANIYYPAAGQGFRDADRYVFGGALGHAYRHRLQPVVYLGVYAGKEEQKLDSVPQVGFDILGLRGGGELRFDERTKLFLNVAYEDREYGAVDPFFLVTRHDKQLDIRLGLEFRPWKDWKVAPGIQYTDNSSNIEINEFDRTVAAVFVRREF
jgi:tetratricopeptide (TPR) repeat protein